MARWIVAMDSRSSRSSGGAVGLAHPHQAEAERGDREALGSERACGQHGV